MRQLIRPIACTLLILSMLLRSLPEAQGADPQRSVNLAQPAERKVLTGVLGTLAVAGTFAGLVLLSMNGTRSDDCPGCVRNTLPSGVISLSLGVLAGGGAMLAWWLPAKSPPPPPSLRPALLSILPPRTL